MRRAISSSTEDRNWSNLDGDEALALLLADPPMVILAMNLTSDWRWQQQRGSIFGFWKYRARKRNEEMKDFLRRRTTTNNVSHNSARGSLGHFSQQAHTRCVPFGSIFLKINARITILLYTLYVKTIFRKIPHC